MIVTHKINMNLDRAGVMPRVDVVQGDANTREIQFSLFSGGQAWEVPTDAQVLVRYKKANGAGGTYDTMSDGAAAAVVSGNTVTVTLEPQALSADGSVSLAVTLAKGDAELSTFAVQLNVMKNPTAVTDDDGNYVSVSGLLPAPDSAEVGQYLEVAAVDENGKITEMKAVDAPSGGLDDDATTLLITILRNGVYSTDQSANITALETALGATGGEVTPDEPEVPDEPDEPVVVTYTITSALVNVESSNTSAIVNEGSNYTATLTPVDGYEIESVIVTMGGVDITATAYANGVVSIASVTGDVVITANAVESSTGDDEAENNGWTSGEAYDIEWTDGYIPDNSTGELTESASWSVSPLLPCAGVSAILSDTGVTGRAGFYWAYDGDGNYLGRTLFVGDYPNAIPSQVKYLKIIKGVSATTGISPTPVKYEELSENTVWKSGVYYEVGHKLGSLNGTGAEVESSENSVSNYCMCYGAVKLTIYPQNETYSRRFVAFYDGDKNFVSSASGNSWDTITECEIPEDAVYFRIACYSGVQYGIVNADKPIVTLE